MTDTRNIIDFYRYWSVEAIKTNLDLKRHNFSILISNQIRDFNLSTVIRNSNAFLAKEVFIYGSKNYDRRGTVGTHHYENIRHVRHISELNFEDCAIVGIDNIDGALPIESFVWDDKHTIMVFGEEQIGLCAELRDLCQQFVYISQFGSVRSLNVGSASAIAMYDYCQKMVRK